MILIVSDPEEDVHVPYVLEELDRRGLPYLVFDPATYLQEWRLTIASTDDGAPHAVLSGSGTELDLANVSGAWYRRPGTPVPTPNMDVDEADWMREEAAHVLRGAWEHIPADRWMSHPSAVRRSSVKLWQLQVAHGLGLQIPPYTVTNEPNNARDFVRRHSTTIAKSLTRPFVVYQARGEVAVMYTTPVNGVPDVAFDHVANGPTFLQKYVDKDADVRVTVVGEQVFAVEIDARVGDEVMVDFRSGEVFDLPHRVVDLPASLATACRDLVRGLALTFGAIDLVRDREGDYWFLEINPNGQWMWLEWASGAPIRSAVCDWLARSHT
jgi:hypothetical protein